MPLDTAQQQPKRSTSRARPHSPPARPTTPLRPPSRTSLRSSHTPNQPGSSKPSNPLAALETPFGDLADSMADLEANFVHLQLMHESLSRFNECFASFLYGLNVNAYCVDFPEAPTAESFNRARDNPRFEEVAGGYDGRREVREFGRSMDGEGTAATAGQDIDQTFLTTDTSFVNDPPAPVLRGGYRSSRGGVGSRTSTPGKRAPTSVARGGGRGGVSSSTTGLPRGVSGISRGRSSGLARATGRGRGNTTGR